jgi:hypothetical protein
MGELKLAGMHIVKDLETEEEFSALRDFLLTDPLKITHSINFWKSELPNSSEADKVEINEIITSLKNLLKNQARLTCNVYAWNSEEVTEVKPVIEQIKETNIENKPTEHVSNLKLVAKDGEDVIQEESQEVKTLREKYASFIKEITVDDLMKRVKDNIENEELARFILSEGLYKGKKAKKWQSEAIEKWLLACKPTVATIVEETEATEGDTDFHKKYAAFLGEHKMTLGALRAETKFSLGTGEVEKGLELATFILGSGEYADDAPKQWSAAEIEAFVLEIKNELAAVPLDLKPEGSTDILPKAAAEIEAKEKIVYDIKITEMYSLISEQALAEKPEDEIKKFIFETIKSKKVENLDMFQNVESTQEELDSMYVTFFESFIINKYNEAAIRKLDVKAELTKLIDAAVDAGDKGLSKVIQEARKMYEKRGEPAGMKECKEIVYAITEEYHPEYYKQLMENLGEKKKVAIVQETVAFDVKYPELYETVKDCKYLDDIYTMAREMEKTQSFLVVSEMIIHLISSGKISHSADKPLTIKWDNAQIELWINSMFKEAETVAETAAEVSTPVVEPPVIEVPTTEVPTTEVPVTPVPTEEVVSPEITTPEKAGNTETEVSAPEEAVAGPVEEVVVSDSVVSAPENTVEIVYPNGVTVPEEDNNFKGLYAKDKIGFEAGFKLVVNTLTTEGKSKKEITHLLADKIKELSKNDDLTQCHVRNFKRSNINELYQAVNKIAARLEIEGWII